MPAKRYRVTLTPEEYEDLVHQSGKGVIAVRRLKRIQILLHTHAGLTDQNIMNRACVSRPTVERVRKRFVVEGLEAALTQKKRSRSRTPKLDGAGEAHLIRLACSTPPEGRAHWTLRLLADKLIELKVVDTISGEAVRERLKKMNFNRG